MKRTLAVAILFCAAVSVLSCSGERKEQGASPPAAPVGANAGQAPAIPIDEMPEVLKSVQPVYPEDARTRGEEGIVRIKALVGKDGLVKEAAADSSAVSPSLANAALVAVRQWTFTPGRSKGEPVEVWIIVPVNFRLAQK